MESKLQQLRVLTRKNSKAVIDYLIRNYIDRSGKPKYNGDRCFICGNTHSLTKEHVLPQWVFDGDLNRVFVTDVNQIEQKYYRATVPACMNCNSNLLGSLDRYVSNAIRRIDLRKVEFFNPDELEAIIRWLELIDYKFQFLNFRRRFLRPKKGMFVPYLKDFSLAMIRDGGKNVREVIAELRRSRRRITIKNKQCRHNSLVILVTKNKSLHFFHRLDDFIFLEFGAQGVAFFYFYKGRFDTSETAEAEAMKIVERHY